MFLYCLVNGYWGSWYQNSGCSVTCGYGGFQTMVRHCDSPRASYGGNPCNGGLQEEMMQAPCDFLASCEYPKYG